MALTNADVVALQLERSRKRVAITFPQGEGIWGEIEKRDVEKVSTRGLRILLASRPGGNTTYSNFDGTDLGRGTADHYDFALISAIGLSHAIETNFLAKWATDSTEKAVASAVNQQLARAMKTFRRDINGQLQIPGNGVIATISAIAGNPVFTLTSAPFGARLIRENTTYQIYDTTLTTNRGTFTASDKTLGLGQAQTVTMTAGTLNLANVVIGDVIVLGGLSGASPVTLYGIPYHHNSSSTGSWQGIARSNSFVQAPMVDAKQGGLTVPHLRLAYDSIAQALGYDEEEQMKGMRWYGHMAQKAAYEEIAFSIARLEKGGSGQNVDLLFGSSTIGGIKPIWHDQADETRLDLLNLDVWGRGEWREIDILQVGNNTVHPVYGASGGLAAAELFYLCAGFQMFTDNPKALSGVFNLAVTSGY